MEQRTIQEKIIKQNDFFKFQDPVAIIIYKKKNRIEENLNNSLVKREKKCSAPVNILSIIIEL